MVHVDFETLERIPKESYRFYREVCRTRGTAIPTDIAPMR